MKRVLVVAFLVVVAVVVYGKLKADPPALTPLLETPYVIVYGNERCGYTRGMREELEKAGVPYEWRDYYKGGNKAEIIGRMEESGISTNTVYFPVVDVNAKIFVRPQPAAVIEKYRNPGS